MQHFISPTGLLARSDRTGSCLTRDVKDRTSVSLCEGALNLRLLNLPTVRDHGTPDGRVRRRYGFIVCRRLYRQILLHNLLKYLLQLRASPPLRHLSAFPRLRPSTQYCVNIPR